METGGPTCPVQLVLFLQAVRAKFTMKDDQNFIDFALERQRQTGDPEYAFILHASLVF